MPRLPVVPIVFALLLTGMMTVPVMVQAQRSLVSSVAQLDNDKGVRGYREMYAALSGANLIFAQCGDELNISDGEQDYLKQKFTSVTQGYFDAYQHAYVTTTGGAAPQAFMNDVGKALTVRQQDAVNDVASVIDAKGCRDGRLRMLTKYVASLHKQDQDALNAKPVEPAQPYH